MAGGVGGIIVWAFIVAGVVALAGLAFFMWLNARSSSVDDRTYDITFDPEKLVSKYKMHNHDDAEESGAAEKLRRYAYGPKRTKCSTSSQEHAAESPMPQESEEVIEREAEGQTVLPAEDKAIDPGSDENAKADPKKE